MSNTPTLELNLSPSPSVFERIEEAEEEHKINFTELSTVHINGIDASITQNDILAVASMFGTVAVSTKVIYTWEQEKKRGGKKKQKMLKRKRELEPDLGITNNKEKIYHQFVSEKSTDPVPEEVILSQTSLKKFYTPLYKNKVRLFTERNKIKENILIAKFFPFDEMKEEKLDGWQFLVSFLLNQCCFNKEVNKSNSSLISGKMFAEGWQESSRKKTNNRKIWDKVTTNLSDERR
ncbi:hypothetical protein BY996DRAFT_7112816 [Phakopsora pachyrhizi]|nr:hypothetical protein BY996DRAFT_7112816 [Phakopsora pachyrhizi]